MLSGRKEAALTTLWRVGRVPPGSETRACPGLDPGACIQGGNLATREIQMVSFAAGCDAIVTYNKRDFRNIGKFGLKVLDPRELLFEIGAIK